MVKTIPEIASGTSTSLQHRYKNLTYVVMSNTILDRITKLPANTEYCDTIQHLDIKFVHDVCFI